MPADINPHLLPTTPAICPRRLIGEGPRCRSLVLAGDADEHEAWHDKLDELLTAPVETTDAIATTEWPVAMRDGTVFD